MSFITLKSGRKVQVTMKEGSFRRITGLREHVDVTGSFIIRRVEIKKEPGKSLGFYIRVGDGWMRKSGIFVSKINLGSIVDVNRLLNVGDEIVCINDVDVTDMELDDVVLIMQFIQKIILTVKVLRGVADTLHCLKKRKTRRELPKTPSFLEKDNKDVGNTVKGSSSHDLDWNLKGYDKAVNGTTAVAHQIQGSKTVSETVEVDIHPYDDGSEGDDSQSKIQSYPGGTSHRKAKRDEINPYSKIALASVSAIQNPNGDDEDINPYAEISSELRAKLTARGDPKMPASWSLPDPIKPYSEIWLQPRVKPEASEPEDSGKTSLRLGSPDIAAGDEINPYAQVSKEFKEKLFHSKTTQYEGNQDKSIEHNLRVLEFHGSSTSLDENPAGDSNRLSFILQDNTPHKDQMNLEGLLDIIKTAQFVPRSPVIRKSFILEDSGDEEPVVDPSHIYAEVDRSRQQSLVEIKRKRTERISITLQPPSPPKSPVPFELGDPNDTLPVILAGDGEDSLVSSSEHSNVQSYSSSHPESSHDSKNMQEIVDRSQEMNSVSLGPKESVLAALTEALMELDQEDTDPPPLPPPYVPDEGPPELSDSEDEREEELEDDNKVLAEEITLKNEWKDSQAAIPSGNSLSEAHLHADSSTDEQAVPHDSTAPAQVTAPPPPGPHIEKVLPPSGGEAEATQPTLNVSVDSNSELPLPPPVPTSGPPEINSDITPDLPELLPEEVPPELPSSTPPTTDSPALPPKSDPKPTHHQAALAPELPPDQTPPPPLPVEAPPEDDENTDEEMSDGSSDGSDGYMHLPTMKIEDIVTSSPSDKRFSGMIEVKISRLDTTSKNSTNFWSTNAVQKMIFILSVDNCIKINTNLPLVSDNPELSEDNDEYHIILLQNFHIKFSLHSICLPNISKCTKLAGIFPSQEESSRKVLIGFEHYGNLLVSLVYHPMQNTVGRLNSQWQSHKAQFLEYVLLNNVSDYPLILERSLKVVEKYGLKIAHLYDRCASKLQKQRALASCMEDLDHLSMKKAVTMCSVHAYTGIIVDFFRDLPEPFFTNKLASELTEAARASRDPEVLDQYLKQLPKAEMKTLRLLHAHFKTVCKHGSKNGASVKLVSRLFGPLLLIPSLSPKSEVVGQSVQDFADDYFSQSRVIELLFSLDTF